MAKITPPLILLALLVAVVIGFEDRRPRADFVYVHGSDLFTLDPQKMSYQHDLRMAKALYEPLAAIDPEGRVVPAAARDWEVSEDGRRWTFHLRDGLRFSDGDPVTSDDFVFAWRRGLLPDSAGPYSSFFWVIDGARGFAAWREDVLALRTDPTMRDELVEAGRLDAAEADEIIAESAEATLERTWRRFDETVGVSAPDERTIVVDLERPLPYFADYVAFMTWSPVHRPTLEAATTLETPSGRLREDPGWAKAGRLVGNGPYRLARWRYQRDCRVERNEHYWNTDAVPLDSIEAVVIEDPNTAIMAFLAGDVDWLPDVIAEQKSDLLAERQAFDARHADEIERRVAAGEHVDDVLASLPAPGDGERRDLHALDAFGTDYFQVYSGATLADGRPNPLADARVRRALALAIDKQAISDRVTKVGENPARTLVPPASVPGYDGPEGLPFDPDRARRELEAAGWIRGDDGVRRDADGTAFPTVEILYSTGSPRYRGNSLAIRDMWRRELSIPAEVRGRPGKDYREKVEKGEFMVARGGWFGDYGDPTTFLDMHRTDDSNNHRDYSNPEFDRLLDAAASETDAVRRFALLEEAERIVVEDDLPVIPIATYKTLYMYEPGRVRGFTHHPRLEQHPARWRIERD
ncbi:MAG: peptide ABC transporter substrate-binding protein [Planctomycetota bacterium]|nr:peptide ABC transporter substrate-binding protein [Planctomycetota bacterium]